TAPHTCRTRRPSLSFHSQVIPAFLQTSSTARRSSVWKNLCQLTSSPSEKLRTYITPLVANSRATGGARRRETSRQSTIGVAPPPSATGTQKKLIFDRPQGRCELSF